MEEPAGGPGAPSGPAAAAAAAGSSQPPGGHQGPAGAQPTAEVQQRPAQPQAGGRRQLYDDNFMMWVWKVEMCKRVDKHQRESCPYAHPGELARRRHPSLYQALPCPEARAKKICPRLETCNCSHSTFEYWLHPSRFKTFLCERGEACDRPICFFAHTPAELRELPEGLQRTQPAPRHAPPEAAAGTPSSSSQFPGYHPAADQGAASSSLQQGYAGSSSSSWTYQQQRGAAAGEPQHGLGPKQPAQQLFGSPKVHPPGAGSSGMTRSDAHRGATVAVIPAGPSVWQNNSLLQSESGEAPNLEELCAAVTRMAMQQQADQASDQLAWQQQQQQQHQQHVQQPGFKAAVAAMPAQFPAPVMGMQQGVPGMTLLPVYAGQQQQQQQPAQQQPASQQPQQQQVMLPDGQVIFVQVHGGSSPAHMPWSSLQPNG